MLFSSKYVIWKDFSVPPSLARYTHKKCQHELPAETSFLNLSTCLLTAACEENKCAYNAFMSYIVMIGLRFLKSLSSKPHQTMGKFDEFKFHLANIFSRRRLECKMLVTVKRRWFYTWKDDIWRYEKHFEREIESHEMQLAVWMLMLQNLLDLFQLNFLADQIEVKMRKFKT